MYYKYLRIFNHNIWQHSWTILDGNTNNIIFKKYKYFFKIYIELHNKLTTIAHTTDHNTFFISIFGRFPEQFLLEIRSLHFDTITIMYLYFLEMIFLEMLFLEMVAQETVFLEMVYSRNCCSSYVRSRNGPF